MVNTIDLLGVGYLLASLILLPVVYYSYKNKNKMTGLWMMVLSIGVIGVSIVYGLRLILDEFTVVTSLDNIKYIFLNIMEISFLFLTLEYARKEKWRDWKKVIPPFVVLIILVQAIVWTNPSNLMRQPGTYVDVNGVLQNEFGILLYIIALIGYIPIIVGLSLLIESSISSRGIYRKQSLILIVAVVISSIFNLLYAFDLTYIDLTPVGLIIFSLMISWAIFRYQFLEMIPIARKEIIDTMNDAAVVLNDDGRIMDINASALELLNLEGDDVIGQSGNQVFSEYSDIIERYKNDKDAREEIEVTVNSEQRHFDLNLSSITDNTGEVLGRVIVLRDITELKNHEKEIELLKDVQSRVLRHNLRNELGLIRGWAEAFREKYPEDDETFLKMMEIVDKIIERGEKARTIERILDYSQGVDEVEVTKMVEDSVMSLWNSYPGVDFNTEMPEDVYAYAITDIGIGISNLVENAAEHNDADDPRVEVTVRETGDGWVEVEVWDNGSGIPEAERKIIEEGEETPLRHGSGVGLWLVDWVVSKSNGELVFDSGDGNTVTVRLRASRRSTW